MRCFYVLVHGRLDWRADMPISDSLAETKPCGMYCHRYVLSTDAESAKTKAFERVRNNLDQEMGWLSKGWVTLALEADAVVQASMLKLVRPDNCGHTFYTED